VGRENRGQCSRREEKEESRKEEGETEEKGFEKRKKNQK
jgi:hypothetical protein